jgi:hypothetical protein
LRPDGRRRGVAGDLDREAHLGLVGHRALPGPENRRFVLLSTLRAHAKAPCKTDSLWETLRALNRPGRARTVSTAISKLAAVIPFGRAPPSVSTSPPHLAAIVITKRSTDYCHIYEIDSKITV